MSSPGFIPASPGDPTPDDQAAAVKEFAAARGVASHPDGPTAQVPLEVLAKLQSAAEAYGIELPGIARMAPTIDVTQPIRNLALELGRSLSLRNIFIRGNEVGTVDPQKGEWRRMTARRFPSWCEEFVGFKSPGARRDRDSLSVETAAQILEADVFLSCLRPIEAIHTMILPVRRESGAVEFLAPGYDAESRIYTVDLLKYPRSWTIEQAKAWLEECCRDYPWNWPTDEPGPLWANRSFCAHVGVMLGVYCRALFPPGIRRPMVAYLSNQPGSGKSTLVAMVLMPVYGTADDTTVPKDDDKMKEELNAIALNRVPYVFFDDIGRALFSNPLNAFVTAAGRASRILRTAETFSVKLATQVFTTGNDITVSDDLTRRSVIVELFLPIDARSRKFAREITVEWLSRDDVRAQFLAAMCAFVRNYIELVPSLTPDAGTAMPTFEVYSRAISAMVQCAGYSDPMQPPAPGEGGNDTTDEMRELLIRVASEAEGDQIFDRKQLVEKARAFELLEPLVGCKGDPDLDSSGTKKWGRQLQKWRGRHLTDNKGRLFQFARKDAKNATRYPLTFLP